MKTLPQADRYYLIGFRGGKTHLLYFDNYDYHIACFPNMTIEMCSCSEGIAEGITRDEADRIDQYYNELTCPTCLKMAQGNLEVSKCRQKIL